MDLGLDGRTVIVTGGAGGLGREIVRGFAAEGASVVVAYHRSAADAELLVKEIGDRAVAVPYGLGDPASARALVAAATEWNGRVDVLVNNAVAWGGMTGEEQQSFEAIAEDEWLDALRQNIEGAVQLSREVTPSLREQGWGRLVHVSSTIAVDGMAGGEFYATAKAALHGFSRSVAFSLGRDGDILSNVVMPGLTRTDTNSAIVEAAGEHFSALAPIGRLLDASEVANSIVYLGSAANTGITGQVIAVSGG